MNMIQLLQYKHRHERTKDVWRKHTGIGSIFGVSTC